MRILRTAAIPMSITPPLPGTSSTRSPLLSMVHSLGRKSPCGSGDVVATASSSKVPAMRRPSVNSTTIKQPFGGLDVNNQSQIVGGGLGRNNHARTARSRPLVESVSGLKMTSDNLLSNIPPRQGTKSTTRLAQPATRHGCCSSLSRTGYNQIIVSGAITAWITRLADSDCKTVRRSGPRPFHVLVCIQKLAAINPGTMASRMTASAWNVLGSSGRSYGYRLSSVLQRITAACSVGSGRPVHEWIATVTSSQDSRSVLPPACPSSVL
jgi:hypothetical protein